jgi:hypothetical protein
MKRYFKCRLFVLLAVAFLATALTAQPPIENPDPNGGGGGLGSCVTCHLNQHGDSISLSCITPSSGGWGHQYCRVESYYEGTYCFTDGNLCCVD